MSQPKSFRLATANASSDMFSASKKDKNCIHCKNVCTFTFNVMPAELPLLLVLRTYCREVVGSPD